MSNEIPTIISISNDIFIPAIEDITATRNGSLPGNSGLLP
jgi:hypothetical protein